ncbi:hypothetical protein [Lentibacillus saliphilus]|uniref:hypothetical protein n=1 Tax=Lentibacillus saliphilus TaxID=2737028 RepID=UPI001C2F143B|nr:hypothetical protein [Lentibacillus saliphilus]
MNDLKFTGEYVYFYDEEDNETNFIGLNDRESIHVIEGNKEIVQVEGSEYRFYTVDRQTGDVTGYKNNGQEKLYSLGLELEERIIELKNPPFLYEGNPQMVYTTSGKPYIESGEKLFSETDELMTGDLLGDLHWVHEEVFMM